MRAREGLCREASRPSVSPCPVQVVLEKQNGSWLQPEGPRADSWEDQVRSQRETPALWKEILV